MVTIAACTTCESLLQTLRIREPRELDMLVESLHDYVAARKLEMTSSEIELEKGPLDLEEWSNAGADFKSLTMKCTDCGAYYDLSVELYHGSGGTWARRE